METVHVTMREVAARCGVSQPTVSLCLNHSPLVAEATRRKVCAVAQEMGYRKHPLVAAHMRYRRKPRHAASRPLLALVNTQATAIGWRKAQATVLRQMFAGAMEQAAQRGYNPQEFWLHEPGISQSRFSAILRSRGVTGLLIGPSSNRELTLELGWDDFSCVQLGSGHVRPVLHRIINDHHQSAMLAVQELYKLGYRRPGFVVEDSLSLCHDRRWEAGFLVACNHQPDLRPVPILLLDSIDDRAALLRWYDKHRPDVVLEATESVVLQQLRSARYAVPKTIGVMTLGSPGLRSSASGTVQDGFQMGANAIDLLITHVERHETGLPIHPITQMTRSTWNPGETLRRHSPRRS